MNGPNNDGGKREMMSDKYSKLEEILYNVEFSSDYQRCETLERIFELFTEEAESAGNAPDERPGAFPARSRSAEAPEKFIIPMWGASLAMGADEPLKDVEFTFPPDALMFIETVKRAAPDASRNSDGERSEHRAGNAEDSGRLR